ncbi:N-acetyltransferase 9, partial [Varanus komodoensis]
LDPGIAANYRPVANIPFLGKVLERVVAGQLQALLDETDYLDPFQSGFRPGYGTESALVALYDDLCREKDRGSASLLVLLDLSAAFDTIDHGILLDRLAGLGVGGTALRWFRSYLNDRFQKVVLGDYGSAPWQLCHGVPQGSILSPLLFNIYMKPLGEVIRRCGLRTHQYADDTQLYLSFSTNPGEAVAVLNRCLAEVMGWMRANKLKLNPDKTEVLLVGGSGFGEGDLNLVLNGVALPPRDKVHSLGVLLDPELSLEAQVTTAARSAPTWKCTFIVLDTEKWSRQATTEEECMVGDVNLFLTDPEDPTVGEIEIMIAEASYRGRGFGKEATLIMMSYGVTHLGITTFEAKIGLENEASIGMFKKIHFKEVGVNAIFQEVTLKMTVDEQERQWLLEQTSHVNEKEVVT